MQFGKFSLLNNLPSEFLALGQKRRFILAYQGSRSCLTHQQFAQCIADTLFQAANLVFHILGKFINFHIFNGKGTLILVNPFAGKNLGVNDNAFNSGRHPQGRILHITSLVTKNSPQQFFLRGKHCFTLGSYLAHQRITGFDFSTNSDDAAFIKIP